MAMSARTLIASLALLPLMVQAQVPVVDGGGYPASYPPAGFGTSGASAAVGASAPATAQGELFMQLQQMQQEIALLRGMLEEQQNEIQQLKREGLERYQDLDARLSGQAALPSANASSSSSSAPAAAAGAAPQAPAAQAAQAPADPAKEKLFYDAAFDLIKAKDFAKATQAFTAFLQKFPASQYAGNAQYWLGEVNLAQGNLQAAGQAFAQVSVGYPQHAKVPDALFKLADVEQRLGNTAKAKGILQQVVQQYPGSSAAQLAQRDLQRLP